MTSPLIKGQDVRRGHVSVARQLYYRGPRVCGENAHLTDLTPAPPTHTHTHTKPTCSIDKCIYAIRKTTDLNVAVSVGRKPREGFNSGYSLMMNEIKFETKFKKSGCSIGHTGFR